MRTLLKNGRVVNVFTGEIEQTNVLIEGSTIIGVGDYTEADVIEDISGRYVCPGFIDGHIHIESTMLSPKELAKVCVPHGTCAIVADPHEIANVCGSDGIAYMLESSEGLPMKVFFTLPSCVPATGFDESGAVLQAEDLEAFYENDSVIGLAEMMNYVGVINDDPEVLKKLESAKHHGRIINGHAPLLSGRALDKYIAKGITDDHECCSFDEAAERIRKGQWVMIRQGTSARNLNGLIELFERPYSHRCMLVTDDKHPYDLLENGHIDSIIREAVKLGKSAITGIQMATIQAAEYYGLKGYGAVAPGYLANILVIDDLDAINVRDVYHEGVKVVSDSNLVADTAPALNTDIAKKVMNSFNIKKLDEKDFIINNEGSRCRVIKAIPGELLTDELICEIDFDNNNGIDVNRDIIKIAVCERHHMTGNIGLGFISGLGLKNGAIASSVSHDSHNLIIAGTNEADMALAGNTVSNMGGGMAVVCDGQVVARLELVIAGLMSTGDAETVADENRKLREAVRQLKVAEGIEPFMNMGFISLPVIPKLKLTTKGLVDVNSFKRVSLFAD